MHWLTLSFADRDSERAYREERADASRRVQRAWWINAGVLLVALTFTSKKWYRALWHTTALVVSMILVLSVVGLGVVYKARGLDASPQLQYHGLLTACIAIIAVWILLFCYVRPELVPLQAFWITVANAVGMFGNYMLERMLRQLGSGGMGTVHEVERIADGKHLALDHRARFGDVRWVRPILRQIAAALAALHARGIVHRDLKPANVLYDGETAKVADFGIASPACDEGIDSTVSVGLTRTGAFMGTPPYMAPELGQGARAATPASDIFALGVPVQLRPLPSPTLLPGETGALVGRCLSADPVARPSAREIEIALG